jgi:aminopeptidase-like protein
MKEAQHINKSLSALGDVMEALDQKSKHVPYRYTFYMFWGFCYTLEQSERWRKGVDCGLPRFM